MAILIDPIFGKVFLGGVEVVRDAIFETGKQKGYDDCIEQVRHILNEHFGSEKKITNEEIATVSEEAYERGYKDCLTRVQFLYDYHMTGPYQTAVYKTLIRRLELSKEEWAQISSGRRKTEDDFN